MQSEFNEIILKNDDPPVNAAAAEFTSVAVIEDVAERTDNISEAADSISHTSGKVSKFASKTIALAGVITVAAAVVVAAADAEPVVPVAPSAVISDITVTAFVDDSELSVDFYFTGTDEIENYTVWIEDSGGATSECAVENDGDLYTAYAALADGTDIADGLYLVMYASTYDGWEGEILRQQLTLPSAPAAFISDIGVSLYADDSYITVDYTYTDTQEIKEYTVWIEDGGGVVSECAAENSESSCSASATLADGTDTASGLYLVVYATTNDGWQGEVVRQRLTLPEAPVYEFFYADMDPTYSELEGVGDLEIYFDYGTDYPDTLPQNVHTYELYFVDEDGQIYDCEITYSGSGVIWSAVTLPTDGTVSLDVYGRLTLVVKAYTDEGWEGVIYSDKFVVSADGYLSLPEIYYVDITSSLDGVYYTEVTVMTYDPDAIWSDLYITVYDENGELFTEQLMTSNENIGWEDAYYNDEVGGYYFYIFYQTETLTLINDEAFYVVITATWCEPSEDGTENIYDSVVYDKYVYI